MNISRAEIIASVAGIFAGVAAITSVAAAVNTPKPLAGVAEFDLGKTTQVEDWSFSESSFSKKCSVSGNVTYSVTGPENLTGVIRGNIDFDHGTQYVTGSMIDGEGELQVSIMQFNNEDACDLKKASDLEVETVQINVIPAVVSAID